MILQDTEKDMISIREARISDMDDIAEIIISAWQHGFDGLVDASFPKTMSKEKYASIFVDTIQKKTEKAFVFEQDNVVLGYASGKLLSDKYDSEVRYLYVHPEAQGNGIGSKLLEEMKSYFRVENCKTMIIWTLLGARNNQFYSDHGGSGMETKELEIGSMKYSGVGYCFDL